MRSKTLIRKGAALAIAAAVVLLDQLTKSWALRAAPPGSSVELLPGLLRVHVSQNSGVAFSMLRNAGTILVVGIIIAVVVILFALKSSEGWWQALSLGLVLGGAVGNLVDRLTRGPGLLDGRVVDWIDPSFFPTFNIADSAITIGVVLLLITSLRQQ